MPSFSFKYLQSILLSRKCQKDIDTVHILNNLIDVKYLTRTRILDLCCVIELLSFGLPKPQEINLPFSVDHEALRELLDA